MTLLQNNYLQIFGSVTSLLHLSTLTIQIMYHYKRASSLTYYIQTKTHTSMRI